MFRQIPGNSEYIISLSQEIRSVDGGVVDLPVVDGKVEIGLYGNRNWFDVKWLSLIAHFEMVLPGDPFKGLMNVEFCDTNINYFKPISSKVPVFRKPVTITKDNKIFRIIPRFPKYAVSKDGQIIEWETMEQLRVGAHRGNSVRKTDVDYPQVYVYNPETMFYRYMMIHRIVAMAWVKNPDNDFVERPIVNHMDGDKSNYHANNLEWCSFKHNSVHAVNAGLRGDNLKCRVRDFETGTIREFSSLSQAEQFMGLSTNVLRTNKINIRPGMLLGDRYEFRLEGDETPWFYENRKEKVKPGRYGISVTHEDGTVEEFYDTRDFTKRFALWNCPGMVKLVPLAKAKYPTKKFELIDFYNSNKIQAYRLADKTIIETKTMVEMTKITGVSGHALVSCLKGQETFVENGYAYRYKVNKAWDTAFIDRPTKLYTRFKMINENTSEELTFNSLREAERVMRLDRSSIKSCLEKGAKIKGWTLVKLPDENK